MKVRKVRKASSRYRIRGRVAVVEWGSRDNSLTTFRVHSIKTICSNNNNRRMSSSIRILIREAQVVRKDPNN